MQKTCSENKFMLVYTNDKNYLQSSHPKYGEAYGWKKIDYIVFVYIAEGILVWRAI